MSNPASSIDVRPEGKQQVEKYDLDPLENSRSVTEAQTDLVDNEAQNGSFHRTFTPRQVHITSLGSNIGSGVFITIGKSLAQGGPGNMIIAYAMVCTCVWAVLQSLSEMTIAFPVPGNYIDYADRWVDPALAFGSGFAEWLGWTAIIASEAGFFHLLLNYWAENTFPLAGTVTIFLVVCLVVFLLPTWAFAWFEYVTSLVKIFLFLIIIVLSLALVLGAGPNGYIHHGETWTELPPFLNGFSGFATGALLCTWAVGDQVFVGIIAGETKSPRFSMGHATQLVPFRISFVIMTSVLFITLLVRSDDDRLLSGSGVAASPFIIAVDQSGIPGIASLLNAGMMCSILGVGAEGMYLSSRVLWTMAHQGLIPQRLARVDEKGRPRLALLITGVVAIALSYMQIASDGSTALNWLISITSASYFTNWIIISFTNWRFHRALRAQNDQLFSELYAWRSSRWPLAPCWLMLTSTLLLVCCIVCGVEPPNSTGFSVENFFQYTIGLFLIVGSTLAYKAIFRTPWRDPKTADCSTGRRALSPEEIAQLDEYYRQPPWRRFLTYVQLW